MNASSTLHVPGGDIPPELSEPIRMGTARTTSAAHLVYEMDDHRSELAFIDANGEHRLYLSYVQGDTPADDFIEGSWLRTGRSFTISATDSYAIDQLVQALQAKGL